MTTLSATRLVSATTSPSALYGYEEFSRRKARRVSLDTTLFAALGKTVRSGKIAVDVDHGGSVANKYGYAAESECITVIATPDGRAWVWFGWANANKISYGGACRASCPVSAVADLFDKRCGSDRDTAALVAAKELIESGEYRPYCTLTIAPEALAFLRGAPDAVQLDIFADWLDEHGHETSAAKIRGTNSAATALRVLCQETERTDP